MSASLPAVQKTWPIGKSYTAHLSIPFPAEDGTPGAAVVEWQPFVPESLTEQEEREYQGGVQLAMYAYLVAINQPKGVTDAAND